jgi:hypothetical protein
VWRDSNSSDISTLVQRATVTHNYYSVRNNTNVHPVNNIRICVWLLLIIRISFQRIMSRSAHNTNTKMFLIIAAFLSISSWSCAAFVPPHASHKSSRACGAHLSMASTMMESTRQSFEERMRNAVLGGRTKEVTPNTKATAMPVNLKIASSLDDYKRIVGGERERIVVVRFYAPWCKVRILLSSRETMPERKTD